MTGTIIDVIVNAAKNSNANNSSANTPQDYSGQGGGNYGSGWGATRDTSSDTVNRMPENQPGVNLPAGGGGTYRDASGNLITKEQAQSIGRIDTPRAAQQKFNQIGGSASTSFIEQRFAREDYNKYNPQPNKPLNNQPQTQPQYNPLIPQLTSNYGRSYNAFNPVRQTQPQQSNAIVLSQQQYDRYQSSRNTQVGRSVMPDYEASRRALGKSGYQSPPTVAPTEMYTREYISNNAPMSFKVGEQVRSLASNVQNYDTLVANVQRKLYPSAKTESDYINAKVSVFKEATRLREAKDYVGAVKWGADSPVLQSMVLSYAGGVALGGLGRVFPVTERALPILSKAPIVGKYASPMGIALTAGIVAPIASQVSKGKFAEASVNVGLMGAGWPYATAGYQGIKNLQLPSTKSLYYKATGRAIPISESMPSVTRDIYNKLPTTQAKTMYETTFKALELAKSIPESSIRKMYQPDVSFGITRDVGIEGLKIEQVMKRQPKDIMVGSFSTAKFIEGFRGVRTPTPEGLKLGAGIGDMEISSFNPSGYKGIKTDRFDAFKEIQQHSNSFKHGTVGDITKTSFGGKSVVLSGGRVIKPIKAEGIQYLSPLQQAFQKTEGLVKYTSRKTNYLTGTAATAEYGNIKTLEGYSVRRGKDAQDIPEILIALGKAHPNKASGKQIVSLMEQYKTAEATKFYSGVPMDYAASEYASAVKGGYPINPNTKRNTKSNNVYGIMSKVIKQSMPYPTVGFKTNQGYPTSSIKAVKIPGYTYPSISKTSIGGYVAPRVNTNIYPSITIQKYPTMPIKKQNIFKQTYPFTPKEIKQFEPKAGTIKRWHSSKSFMGTSKFNVQISSRLYTTSLGGKTISDMLTGKVGKKKAPKKKSRR